MTRNIQAYFQTEDEATSVSTRLQPYSVEPVEVSSLTESLGRDRSILIPLGAGMTNGPSGIGGGGFPVGNNTATGGAVPAGAIFTDAVNGDSNTDTLFDGDRDGLHYVLAVKVEDRAYDEAVEIIRRNNGYLEVYE